MTKHYCNMLDDVEFVRLHQSDCRIVAKILNVPTENILGLSAAESIYGRSRFATEGNGFFGMQHPSPFEIGFIESKEKNKATGISAKESKFKSFKQSADSFAASKFGTAVRGVSDPKKFVTILVRLNFNSGNSGNGGRTGYVDYVVSVINSVKERMTCPE